MKDRMRLHSEEIKEMDELCADKKAGELTLRIALQFHSNQMVELSKKEASMWRRLVGSRGEDKSKSWVVDRSGPIVFLREKTKDEKCINSIDERERGIRHEKDSSID